MASEEGGHACIIDGCKADLLSEQPLSIRVGVCEAHRKGPMVMVNGKRCRYCQQCVKPHDLDDFAGGRRSCKKMLERHNSRRKLRKSKLKAAAQAEKAEKSVSPVPDKSRDASDARGAGGPDRKRHAKAGDLSRDLASKRDKAPSPEASERPKRGDPSEAFRHADGAGDPGSPPPRIPGRDMGFPPHGFSQGVFPHPYRSPPSEAAHAAAAAAMMESQRLRMASADAHYPPPRFGHGPPPGHSAYEEMMMSEAHRIRLADELRYARQRDYREGAAPVDYYPPSWSEYSHSSRRPSGPPFAPRMPPSWSEADERSYLPESYYQR